MEKIYVGHSVFEMDDIAQQKLEIYLKNLKEYILMHNGGVDVYEDIESRIEERLLNLQLNQVITIADIDFLTTEIGKPEEIFASDATKKASAPPKFREIYRNPRKGKFLGVCYGIGKAFNIEPIWIRVVFIILFFGMPFLMIVVYVVAALIMKEEPMNPPGSLEENGSGGNYIRVENSIKRFFDMLYKFGEKVINALK